MSSSGDLCRYGMTSARGQQQHLVASVQSEVFPEGSRHAGRTLVYGTAVCGVVTQVHCSEPFLRKTVVVPFCRVCSRWGRVAASAAGGRG